MPPSTTIPYSCEQKDYRSRLEVTWRDFERFKRASDLWAYNVYTLETFFPEQRRLTNLRSGQSTLPLRPDCIESGHTLVGTAQLLGSRRGANKVEFSCGLQLYLFATAQNQDAPRFQLAHGAVLLEELAPARMAPWLYNVFMYTFFFIYLFFSHVSENWFGRDVAGSCGGPSPARFLCASGPRRYVEVF